MKFPQIGYIWSLMSKTVKLDAEFGQRIQENVRGPTSGELPNVTETKLKCIHCPSIFNVLISDNHRITQQNTNLRLGDIGGHLQLIEFL